MTSTKTLVPQRREDTLYRQRLVEQIRQRLKTTALTLVSAPAGYGKTSLLLDLCHDDDFPYPVCWLSLDEANRDMGAFVHELIAAIQRHFPSFGAAVLQAMSDNPEFVRTPDALGNVFLQDLVEHTSGYFVLVLDDYHAIDRIGRAGRLLGDMLQSPARRWHIIVSGRTVPGMLPLTWVVAKDLGVFIGQDHLAVTGNEVRQILKMRHNLDLTPEQAQELVEASEGWITGITLATSGMWRGARDVLNQARAQGGPVYDYLARQAFEEDPFYRVMLEMSTLQEMNAELCWRALGLRDIDRVLPELERRGTFLTIVQGEDGVKHYRYHHLFRDFLQESLREKEPARFAQLHGQAAGWFEARGQWGRAVAHRAAAGDERAMARAMERGAKELYLSGRLDTLVAWHEAVPKALRPEVPRLLLYAARALFDLGRNDETIPMLRQAEMAFRERGEVKQTIAAMQQRATTRCVQGRYTEMLDIARESLQVCAVSEMEPVNVAEAHRMMGLACFNLGRSEEAVEHLQTALDIHQELGRRETAVTYLDLALVLLRLGRLDACWACQDKAIALYRSMPPSGEFAIALNNIAYGRYYLAGDYAQTLSLLREALEVARKVGSLRAQAFVLLSSADLYRDLGAFQDARERYAQAETLARQSGQADLLDFVLAGTAQLLVQTGDAIKALGLAAQARDQAKRRGDIYQLGLSSLALGAAYLGAGYFQKALAEIENGCDQLKKVDARRDLTRAYMLLARAHQAVGTVDEALEALAQ